MFKPSRPSPGLALAALLLAVALPRVAAAADASLDYFHGPDQAEWLTLRVLEVKLDGQPLAVPLPAKGQDPQQALARLPLQAGAHRLDVMTALDGESTVFTYLDKTRFTMRGVLKLDVLPGDVVEVHSKVVTQEGVTVRWEDRHRLSLEATIRRGTQPAMTVAQVEPAPAPTAEPVAPAPVAAAAPAPVAAAAPAPVAAAAPAPTPAAAPAKAPAAAPAKAPRAPAAGTCAASPVRFAFGKSELTAEAEAALDTLAACLQASGRAVRVDGHTDSQGPADFNEWLGAQRAAAAARHLRGRGVAPDRITVRSMSAGAPVCTESSRACNARNRRVEVTVLE